MAGVLMVPEKEAAAQNDKIMKHPIRFIFHLGWEAFKQNHRLSPEQLAAGDCIFKCRTEDMGFDKEECPSCGYTRIHYNSCGNRNCCICQDLDRQIWLDKRQAELIDTVYYHIVFTLPACLNPLIYANKKLLYGLMHSVAAETILELSKDKKYLGAAPGIMQVLHTWGQNLHFHPHIHAVVTGGGLTKDGRFIQGKKGFFLPVKVMDSKYRGKFLAKLKELNNAGKLIMPSDHSLDAKEQWKDFIDRLYKVEWNVDIRETMDQNKGNALQYLGRYVNRIAISESRIVSVKDGKVVFRAKDNKNGGKKILITVTIEEFIRLYMQHVLPKGFQKIRYYGFVNNAARKKNLRLIFKIQGHQRFHRLYTGMNRYQIAQKIYGLPEDSFRCPVCGNGLMCLTAFKERPA